MNDFLDQEDPEGYLPCRRLLPPGYDQDVVGSELLEAMCFGESFNCITL